jgi:ketosteroid isomerase-like protein
MNDQLISEFKTVEDAFNDAVVSNKVDEISKCISDDWVLIDAQGGIIERQGFLHAVAQGLLSHTTMTKEILRVKIYDDIAIVTGRGKNTGFFKGEPIKADEWITDVFKKEKDKWVCTLTHLTPVIKRQV